MNPAGVDGRFAAGRLSENGLPAAKPARISKRRSMCPPF